MDTRLWKRRCCLHNARCLFLFLCSKLINLFNSFQFCALKDKKASIQDAFTRLWKRRCCLHNARCLFLFLCSKLINLFNSFQFCALKDKKASIQDAFFNFNSMISFSFKQFLFFLLLSVLQAWIKSFLYLVDLFEF